MAIGSKRAAFLSRLSVRWKINLGFGFVLVLLVAVGGIGRYGLDQTETGFNEYARLAQLTVRTVELERNVVALRRDVLNFLVTGNERDLAQVRTLQAQLREQIATELNATTSPERRRQFDQLSEMANQYFASLDRTLRMRQDRDKAIAEQLNPVGERMQSKLDDLVGEVERSNDSRLASMANAAMQEVLQAQLNTMRYL